MHGYHDYKILRVMSNESQQMQYSYSTVMDGGKKLVTGDDVSYEAVIFKSTLGVGIGMLGYCWPTRIKYSTISLREPPKKLREVVEYKWQRPLLRLYN